MKKHFPGLDGLRALSALTVLIFHTDQVIYKFSPALQSRIITIGTQNYAVTIFFVLSGFLITYLLLNEKKTKGKVDLKLFYIRRILKIWPLYFLIIGITFFITIFYNGKFWLTNPKNYLYYIFLIGNVADASGKIIKPIVPFWSIGVEEQFYLFWPFLIKRTNVIKSLLIFFVVFSVLKIAIRLFVHGTPFLFIMETRFSSMAIGAVGAWLYFTKHSLLKIIFNPVLQLISWLVLVSLYFKIFSVGSIFNQEIYSVFFLVIIINCAVNDNTLFKIDNRLFNFLGKISYGIYCWHLPLILLLCQFISPLNLPDRWYYFILILLFISLVTILISWLSYELFEKKFLKLKERFH